jgi:hypothetical protein
MKSNWGTLATAGSGRCEVIPTADRFAEEDARQMAWLTKTCREEAMARAHASEKDGADGRPRGGGSTSRVHRLRTSYPEASNVLQNLSKKA